MPVDRLLDAQTGLGRTGGGPLGMNGGRKGMGGGSRPGGFGPVVDGTVLPSHPFEPQAPAISRSKPLMVGNNRDETVFFFNQQRNTEIYNLTEAALTERLASEFAGNADAVYDAYHKSRPDDSPSDLYIAISTARMIGIGAATIAERKFAQHGAPAYMYIFKHENPALIPGTQHKMGTPHAMEIAYKFNNVAASTARPESVNAAHNMSELWSTFARTGHPAAKGQPAWPAYTTDKRSTMEIDAECTVVDDPYPLERKIWERLDP
jgi:para-nitrobenzyl esterase